MRRTVTVESNLVWVAPDDAVDEATRWQVLVSGRAVDENSGEPVEVTASSTTPNCVCSYGRGGLFGLAGRLRTAAAGTPWTITLSATGYLPTVTSGVLAGIPVTVPDIPLRRQPVRLFGEVLLRSKQDPNGPLGSQTPRLKPLAGVTIVLKGIANTKKVAATAPANVVSLDLPLSARHPLASNIQLLVLSDRPSVPSEPALRLMSAVEAKATTILLATTDGISVGQVLRLGMKAGGCEFVTVASLNPVRHSITLTVPTVIRHRETDPVVRQDAVSGGAVQLQQAGEAGDVCLFVTPAIATTTQAVRISGPLFSDEIRIVRPFSSTTGVDGQWSFPPIGRIASVSLGISLPGHELVPKVSSDPVIHLGVGDRDQRRDFVMKATP